METCTPKQENMESGAGVSERWRGQHLGPCERGIIQAGLRAGRSLREIAREANCSADTVLNERRRGTPERPSGPGRPPLYSARFGQKVYEQRRLRCHRLAKVRDDSPFVRWLVAQVRGASWSLDACVGHARREGLFPREEIPCVKSLYNALHAGRLSLKVFEFPELLRRCGRRRRLRVPGKRRAFCRPIESRSCRVLAGNIEECFKMLKSALNLEREMESRDVDALIGHITVVLCRYVFLAFEQRCHDDPRTLGSLFYACCEEQKELGFLEALGRLLTSAITAR